MVPREHRRHARTALEKGNLTGRSPVDRGKPGSNIHAISDRAALPLHVGISAAGLNDDMMFQDMVDGLQPVRQPVGRPRKRPLQLHGDKGYDYPICRELCRARNITARITRKGIESRGARRLFRRAELRRDADVNFLTDRGNQVNRDSDDGTLVTGRVRPSTDRGATNVDLSAGYRLSILCPR